MVSSVKLSETIKESDAGSSIEKRDLDLSADAEDPESRKFLERKLLRKLDLRISVLVVIYILNYVCIHFFLRLTSHLILQTSLDRSR